MAVKKPPFIKHLLGLRDDLIAERKPEEAALADIDVRIEEMKLAIENLQLRKQDIIQNRLGENTSKIDALDKTMLMVDPEHVALDFSDGTPRPVVNYSRAQLQLAAPTGEAGLETPAASKEASEPAKAPRKSKATAVATPVEPPLRSVTTEIPLGKRELKRMAKAEALAAKEAAKLAEKPARKGTRKAPQNGSDRMVMNQYFQTFDGNDLILKILVSKDEPVQATSVTSDLKALQPIDLSKQELKELMDDKVYAALTRLHAKGVVLKSTRVRANGGRPNVFWEIGEEYRKAHSIETPTKSRRGRRPREEAIVGEGAQPELESIPEAAE